MKKKREAAAPVEEKYDEVRQLVALGRERGFLSYDEINEMLPDEVSSSAEELEEVFSLFETHGIALVDAETREQLGVVAGAAERKEAGAEKEEGKETDGSRHGCLSLRGDGEMCGRESGAESTHGDDPAQLSRVISPTGEPAHHANRTQPVDRPTLESMGKLTH